MFRCPSSTYSSCYIEILSSSHKWTADAPSKYIRVWKISLQSHACCMPTKRSPHQEAKINTFLALRLMTDAMDQNILDTLQLVWFLASEQVNSKSKFFLEVKYYLLYGDVIRDTINWQNESIHQFWAQFSCYSKFCLFQSCFRCCING